MNRVTGNRRRLAGAALVVLAVSGCGAPGRAETGSAVSRQITVSAAASLGAAFGRLKTGFEAANPDVSVTLNLGGSSALAEQIVRGAPVDVFAAADAETMRRVTRAGAAAGSPRVFARNILQIGVPPENPGRVTGLADLARDDLVVALCAKEVPCGRAAAQALTAAGVHASPDTFEPDASATATKVRLGEVDAALVYRTDVLAARDEMRGIDFPAAAKVMNDYLIVRVEAARSTSAAQAFIDYVLSPPGQRVLADAGFRTP